MHRTRLALSLVLLTHSAFPLMTIHGQENRLAKESSSYLKSAAHQPVDWHPWGEEVFALAKKENRPILLDIGAVWCHWCHVMDMESYENPAIAALINENFIPVKVDRDERPDVDARYQAAVGAITGQGGWPLTAFLLPDGRVFYGGTYFPPEDRNGRSGFPTVLTVLAKTYRNENQKVLDNATEVQQAVSGYLQKSGEKSELQESSIDTALSSISRAYDIRNGGFGAAPKFPHTGTIELLLARFDRTGEQWMIDAVTATLSAMAKGGIYDQLGGGFHRYSTDEKWIVPHFEKMLYDNAPLLSNYVHAYQATGSEFFKNVARDIIRFVNEVLTDKQQGGFYASQDADVEFGDDGSFFTWSLEQAAKTVSADELEVLKLHYNIFEQGEMQHDSAQNVLFVDKSVQDISSILRKPLQQVEFLLESGKRKMQESRNRRKAPFVDKTVYANWNGMMISSYFEAAKAFGIEEYRSVALKALDRILRGHRSSKGLITHRSASIAPEAFLEDQVQIAAALLKAFEITGERKYLSQSESLMKKTTEFFWDEQEGGFFDVPKTHRILGALTIPNKPVQDSPTEGANAVAALVLTRLSTLTEIPTYRSYTEKTLRCFSGTVQNFGVFAATYFLALDEFLNPPPHVVVVSDHQNAQGERLFKKALQVYRPGKLVSRAEPNASNELPEVIKSMAAAYSKPTAFVCTNFACAPPVFEESELESTLKQFAKTVHALK